MVILIDCWAGSFGPTSLRDKLYNNILNAISNINPCLVALASYETNEFNDQNLLSNNFYFKNFKKEFLDTKLETISDKYSQYTMDDSTRYYRPTAKIILDAKFNCMQIALKELWQLDQVVKNLKQKIDKIWIFGLHWNQCLKDRPLGWKAVHAHAVRHWGSNVEIWSREDCTLIIPYNDLDKPLNFETWPTFEYDQLTLCKHYSNGDWKIVL
jgi:hypothetical protein